MLCKIISGRLVAVVNKNQPDLNCALYIQAVPCAVKSANGKDVVISEENSNVFSFAAFNQNTFVDTYHTILFPVNLGVMDMLISFCDETTDELDINHPQMKMIHLLKVAVTAPEPYYQVFTNPSKDAKGVPDGRFDVGDYVPDDDGKPKLFTEIQTVVVCSEKEEPLENVTRKAKKRWDTNIMPNKDGIQVFVPKSEYDAMNAVAKPAFVDGAEQSDLPRPFARGARPR